MSLIIKQNVFINNVHHEVLNDYKCEVGIVSLEENGNEQQFVVEPNQFDALGLANEVEVEEDKPQTAVEVEHAHRLSMKRSLVS